MVGNKATEALLGVRPGSNVSETAPLDQRVEHFQAYRDGKDISPENLPLQKAGETGKAVIGEEFELRFDDGHSVWLYGNAVPLLTAEGHTRGAIGAFVDITDRKLMEEALRRSNDELRQFAYITSHDLREPLRMISSYLGLLERKYKGRALDAKAEEYIHFATDGAIRMQQMINDLLTYSRIETKGKELEPVDMNAVLCTVLRNLDIAVKESGAYISCDELPTVVADRSQMTQLLQNLIDNAIKYRRDEMPYIEVSAVKKGGVWLFSVKDNGVGIPRIMGEKVFELFQRGFTQEQVPGTGIGLAIAKKIVERHGGRIWFESEEGRGTTFFFTVPMKV
jgi:light-regulated signal transduction histidine kinase (bacteriophytochrome)